MLLAEMLNGLGTLSTWWSGVVVGRMGAGVELPRVVTTLIRARNR